MKKLAVTQMVLGALAVASLVGFVIWVEPHFYHVLIPPVEGSDIGYGMFFNPGRNISMRTWQTVYLALGISVIGCGVVQYRKARRLKWQ